MKTAALAHTQKFAAVAIITGKKNLFFFSFSFFSLNLRT